MDEKGVRENLEEIRIALVMNEEEHEVLLSLFKGYEGWLRLYTSISRLPPSQLSMPTESAGMPGKGKARDKVSVRSQVLQVLKDARGEPLHTREMLRRLQGMGVEVGGKNPHGMVDLQAYSLRKAGIEVEKVAPRTWRWGGSSNESSTSTGESEERGVD